MEPSLYDEIFKYQGTHWFLAAKKYFFSALIGKNVPNKGSLRIADIGCGTGALLSYLEGFGNVTALDASTLALSYAGRNLAKGRTDLVCAKADKLPFKDNTFDMVCLSDVLYHKNVEDDNAVLAACCRILRKDGLIIFSDSAFKALRSEHDELAHAARRYSKKEITAKLVKCGFLIKRVSYTYMLLFPVAYMVRFAKRVFVKTEGKRTADFKGLPLFLNSVIEFVFFLESQGLKLMNFPFGTSVMAVAVKK
jgi:SAM-dependent methyltransferase